ncbi:MAG: 3-methyl-2-oxobutanoate dehydrogenase subunit VorB [Acidobacteria bacterium]|nr:3-methyl-2-oxobutanoate dehydrogenase subunit VorB [Acidobacteriota bacterium]MCL5288919.1 3-methyl-2-oxobutanoate dehydrogenase subunit VorB [Acidobacteriota bacterium]
MRQLTKGNVAVMKGAVLAGCRAYYGYPITPASEIAEAAALYLPQVGGTFLQAESEVASINMVYGASSAGVRVMTASSGPGLSLMQEGISYLAAAELPCVVVDVVRGGPGLGNIAPEQSDYFAIVKGGGHGCYRNLVVAPASVQEMADLTMLAFELADRYRNPALVLTDGFIGQMMEPLELHPHIAQAPEKSWAVKGTPETRPNAVTSIHLEPDTLEAHVRKLEAKYKEAEKVEARSETYCAEDADVLLVGYGIVSRVLRSTVDQLRERGVRAGLFRPVTLYPFPSRALLQEAKKARVVQVVEMSTGMMVEDVRLAIEGRVPVEFYGRVGGNVPSAEEVREHVMQLVAAPVA